MPNQYRLLSGSDETKPIDMVVIMRRIRSGKITPNTLICVNDEEPRPATEIPELSRFFIDNGYDPMDTSLKSKSANVAQALDRGWQFVMENSIMTVYAGGFLILVFLIAMGLVNQLGLYIGGVISWCLFMVAHQVYFIFIVRMFRVQTMGDDFMNHQFAPILPSIVIFGLVYALFMIMGFAFLILPGFVVAAYLVFTPIIMMDKQLPLFEAIGTSIGRIKRGGINQLIMISVILLLHYISIILIFPAPLTLPLFLAALAEIYEKNSL
ncbi:MAG: hypothetical protein AB7L92_05475 [Alphaproteobacteria bacterium]